MVKGVKVQVGEVWVEDLPPLDRHVDEVLVGVAAGQRPGNAPSRTQPAPLHTAAHQGPTAAYGLHYNFTSCFASARSGTGRAGLTRTL